ncbi:MAG TPA: tRNA uridine-5-carboxymethylaminomethyl(34) synthesis GTPase MnmE [Candidatus Saccharimonadales bacterium]|nr:tRNA uridine-5-carboxymethylaminomethyl(34) synthesis GTPase MnmE [Candidatus Saccharimonadales bacterium]
MNPFDPDDTIAALATAPGPAALALIRVSGRRAFFVADAVFRGRGPLAGRAGHTVAFGQAVDAGGAAIDQVLALVFRAPRSYTGEDMVEFSCHGGETVSRALLAALLAAGARLAAPGEFTRRAYVNGRMDLAQAESVVDVIQAQTARARESALARLQGDLSRRIQALAARAREILLDCEAFLDFQEQLPEDFRWADRAAEARALAEELDGLVAGAGAGRRLRDGARVVLAGRPNVGKSSLLNALLREDRALVSEVPGTTRDVLREALDVGGVPVTLVDTAGLRAGTADALERAGMERAQRELAAADAVVAVVDVSVAPQAEDLEMLGALRGRRGVVAANKVDLGDAWGGGVCGPSRSGESGPGAAGDPAACADWPVVRTSARTGAGLPRLTEALRQILVGDAGREPALVATVRQEGALRTARDALAAAAERLAARELLDAAAFELREALGAFDDALGVGVSASVLDEIFARFCIGK